ncbi:helix-turn-helix domain-containing protein [Microbacterium pygmaeum]|uniref:Helix-turn-helix domain-containing protein n=1 Tax=Microbacterium pygmaeum TaxID=370764 RepID=A0A1G8AL01_9MICO|nr:helix-turn-helix transcriptional regulator [Microbacterium pygmaeum]SDH21631.1 Helix-turn-helix domain-containing protein [Microbacterium pygmaeum]
MDLVRAISTLRDSAGMTNQELIDRSEMSASYFYGRLRGAAPFDANDIERLAQALGIHPHEISRVAASIGDAREIEPILDTDAKELGRRLTAVSRAPRLDGSAFDVDGLVSALADRGVALDPDEWSTLLTGESSTPIRVRMLEGVGAYAGVPTAYLLELDDAAAVEAAEANFEFREALKESGADSVSARAVGEISPAALRAIAQTLRSISAH